MIRERFTALADASAIVGSHATRAQGTIGGNLMNASPAMETGGPLVCFGATATLQCRPDRGRWRWPSSWPAPARPPRRPVSCSCRFDVPASVRHRHVLREARVPPADGDRRRRRDRGRDSSRAVGDRCPVAITALAPTIHRVAEAEAALNGTDGGRLPPRQPQRRPRRPAPISDVRASADYRRAMAAVIARRAIEAAVARARARTSPFRPAIHGPSDSYPITLDVNGAVSGDVDAMRACSMPCGTRWGSPARRRAATTRSAAPA